jgi:hypothetical protein
MKKLIKSISSLSKNNNNSNKEYDNLTNQQLEVFYNIINFVINEDKVDNCCVLDARAGTGKTYLLTSIIKYFLNENDKKLIVAAPTHKALLVIKDMVIKKGVNKDCVLFKTIHKLVKARPFYNDQGELDFIIDIQNTSFKEKNVICLIDESGMIDQKGFKGIKEWITKIKGKIIFFADSYQLPPINENNSLLSEIKQNFTLEKIQRIQEMGLYKVYELFAYFVEQQYFNRELFNEMVNNNDSITIINNNEISNTLVHYKNCKGETKIICFRNNTRKKWNNKIRKIFYPTVKEKITIGEQLISNITFHYDDRQIHSSHFFEVKDIQLKEKKVCNINFLCYIINSNIKNSELSIIHERSENQFKVLKSLLRENIKYNVDNNISNINEEWGNFYRQVNFLNCPLDYSYAITSHKAQGSTFKIVFIDLYDIFTASNDNDPSYSMKMLYTAISRASHHIYLIV